MQRFSVFIKKVKLFSSRPRGGSWIGAKSKMEFFVTIVNGFQSLTIVTKSPTLHFASVQVSASTDCSDS